MFLDELNKMVVDMDTNFKIGHLAEIYVKEFVKKIGIQPIQNWFVANCNNSKKHLVAISIRYKGEQESFFVRDVFLQNEIPVLGFEYDFNKNTFNIYEETSTSYTKITEETMLQKYKSSKRNVSSNKYGGYSRNKEIYVLNNKDYFSFFKSLDNEDIKDFYITRNEEIKKLLFDNFQNIINLDFCYIYDGQLVIVDVKDKSCSERFDKFILNKGETYYYKQLLSLNGVSIKIFALKHNVNGEREVFLKQVINKEKNISQKLYIKKVTKEWLETGEIRHMQEKDTFVYSWDDFVCTNTKFCF